MISIGSLAFLSPWILAGLIALPVIWFLLRAIPPSPRTQIFAGVRLLLGLEDEDRQSDKTPWWLLLLRCAAIAAALIGFAQPVLNLEQRLSGTGPVLVVMDQGWASAPDWTERLTTARAVIEEAEQAGRDVILASVADASVSPSMSAGAALPLLTSLEPRPWAPDAASLAESIAELDPQPGEVVWFHDGIGSDAEKDLSDQLSAFGALRLIGPKDPAPAVIPPFLEDGVVKTRVLRAGSGDQSIDVAAMARTEDGRERRVAVSKAEFTGDAADTEVAFNLPPERQGQLTRIVLTGQPSAGGAAFADGAIRRVRTGLVATTVDDTLTNLTSPTHYLENALVPWADLVNGTLDAVLEQDPPAIILVDHGEFPERERTELTEWVKSGGLLIRFAGPRLAASIGAPGFVAGGSDDLLPVRLRRGGRVLGGALAWTTPRALGPFAEAGPFRGLDLPGEVDVRTQVLAEPSPDLSGKVWASLDDGTPLVTAKRLEEGRIVLFHISSDAEWSSLPLSGLFVEMLGRLMALAPGRAASASDEQTLAGTLWRPDVLMGADGVPRPASDLDATVPGELIAMATAGPELLPGIYTRADGASTAQRGPQTAVVNVIGPDTQLEPFVADSETASVEVLGSNAPQRYGAILLTLAIVLALIDIAATLVVAGRIRIARPRAALSMVLLGSVAISLAAKPVHAQQDSVPNGAVSATAETTLGYVVTGNNRIDAKSEAGMLGLGQAMTNLTAVEPGPPVGVRPGQDELAFYPVLYWPLTEQTIPDPDGLDALSEYIRTGGMLVIDTQSGASGFGGASASQLRSIARALNLPPLAPVGKDHVLTRTFYLLNEFPGRWRGDRIWAEAAPPRQDGNGDADIPQFDRVDDNVSPVIVGSADWAAAWAVDDAGLPLYPIGRPGDRQREMAIRFGVNAVMYALTGNYKSDQVHAPAVLQRLGQ
ncbi:MAG: DUF4159 domain-containing protein [Pseudomonadota bacterium]